MLILKSNTYTNENDNCLSINNNLKNNAYINDKIYLVCI